MLMAPQLALTDLTPEAFEELALSLGEPRHAGRNLLRWVLQRRATDFELMTDLPARFRRYVSPRHHGDTAFNLNHLFDAGHSEGMRGIE